MTDTIFLIDENVLGLNRYLESFGLKFKKMGDPDCPKLGSSDPEVASFAKSEGLVVVTNDDSLRKQCDLIDVKCVFNDLTDLAKKVKIYADLQ